MALDKNEWRIIYVDDHWKYFFSLVFSQLHNVGIKASTLSLLSLS